LKYSANQILFELLSISFLQDFIDYGIGFSFKIHDLVHSCARTVVNNPVGVHFEGTGDVISFPHLCFPENKGLDKFEFRIRR
jgi:hypothetical protein